ncbi:unnamed protein product, partial [Medioppia subpectinata]
MNLIVKSTRFEKIWSETSKQPIVYDESKSTRFEKIWSETSKQPIVYDESRIYVTYQKYANNYYNYYTQCLALCGKDGLPSKLYRLQKNVKCTPLPRDDYKPYFLAVTSDNWLIRYDNVSGKVLQEIYLGYVHKRNAYVLDWETRIESIALLWPQLPTVNNNVPNTHQLKAVIMVVIFKIMPIRFVGRFEVNQTTFGEDLKGIDVSEGLFIVGIGSQKNAKIRIYSLHEILNQTNRLFEATLDKKCPELGGKTGQYPFGLPLNYKIKTAPPVLFEVNTSATPIFGGHPWHYVTNPSNSSGVFEVRNVATNELAENGRFVVRNNTTFADTLTFHTDDTGRLVYESGNYIKFYQIFGEKNPYSIRQQFEMKVRFNDKNGVNNGTEITRRVNARREAKKNICYAEKSWQQILATHFENELDMYSILETNTQLGHQKNNGMITICDNNTGEILHEISLGLTLNEHSDYELIMDLDTIIITYHEYMNAMASPGLRVIIAFFHIVHTHVMKNCLIIAVDAFGPFVYVYIFHKRDYNSETLCKYWLKVEVKVFPNTRRDNRQLGLKLNLSERWVSRMSSTAGKESVKTRPLNRVLIANRGEIAIRVMKSAKRLGLQTI